MINLRCLIVAISAALYLPATAQEQNTTTTPPPPCSSEEYRQLDFWVGHWDLSWPLAEGQVGTGENIITQSDFGACVITENFSMPGFNGMSVSTYDANLKKWRQTWVDDQGGYYALSGGPREGKDHIFELRLTRLTEKAPHLRMIWENVEKDSLVWRWQRRDDAKSWTDMWVINYARRKD